MNTGVSAPLISIVGHVLESTHLRCVLSAWTESCVPYLLALVVRDGIAPTISEYCFDPRKLIKADPTESTATTSSCRPSAIRPYSVPQRTSRMRRALLLHCMSPLAYLLASALPDSDGSLHFHLHERGTNKDGSIPTYKNANAKIEDRLADLLPRMTIEEKISQL